MNMNIFAIVFSLFFSQLQPKTTIKFKVGRYKAGTSANHVTF